MMNKVMMNKMKSPSSNGNPLTSSKKLPPAPFHVGLIFQNKLAKILLEQMRVADKSRIKGKCLAKVN